VCVSEGCACRVSRLLPHTGNARLCGRNLGPGANRGLPDGGERKKRKKEKERKKESLGGEPMEAFLTEVRERERERERKVY
jgi:hypothetical protein